jgi:hypothetical protein
VQIAAPESIGRGTARVNQEVRDSQWQANWSIVRAVNMTRRQLPSGSWGVPELTRDCGAR